MAFAICAVWRLEKLLTRAYQLQEKAVEISEIAWAISRWCWYVKSVGILSFVMFVFTLVEILV